MEFNKVCPGCKKSYISEARSQKYCTPDCGKRYQIRLKKNRRFADENKQLVRMKARCHSLAVEIKTFDDHLKGKIKVCSQCDQVEGLELHHKDVNFTNNTPSNLEWLCTKHHAKVHSELNTKGVEYENSYYKLFKPVIKR